MWVILTLDRWLLQHKGQYLDQREGCPNLYSHPHCQIVNLNNRPPQKIMVVPPLPPRSKVEQLACQPERQRLRNKRPEFKRTSANIFQLWIWGRGGGKCFEKHKIEMGDYFADTGTSEIARF